MYITTYKDSTLWCEGNLNEEYLMKRDERNHVKRPKNIWNEMHQNLMLVASGWSEFE